MIIYVQSRGKNQDQDYRWFRIKAKDYYPENPNFLLQPIINLTVRPIDLIESQKPSIVLVATVNDYCLLVTGLTATERTDFMGRPVRNSVLWICRKDSENLKIRSLLILALREKLDRAIDKTINISGEYGFKVDYKALKELSNSTLSIGNNDHIDPKCKIGKNCDSLREEIAFELESNTLPNKEGLLVLVTSIKSASALKETGVWRGLSSRVESEKLEKYYEENGTKKKTLWIQVAIASILIIAIAFSIIKTYTPPKPEPEVIPTPSTIQKNSPTTSKEELNPSVNLIKAKEISYLISSHIFPEEYGI